MTEKEALSCLKCSFIDIVTQSEPSSTILVNYILLDTLLRPAWLDLL